MARENLFKPASAIVNKVLLDEIPDDNLCPAIAKPENMARATNRLRAYLHGTTLSHATSLRQAYDTNCFV